MDRETEQKRERWKKGDREGDKGDREGRKERRRMEGWWQGNRERERKIKRRIGGRKQTGGREGKEGQRDGGRERQKEDKGKGRKGRKGIALPLSFPQK